MPLSKRLEFSEDDLSVSNTDAAWQDVTSYLIDADWGWGKAKDLDDPQAGTATFRLDDSTRDWEPEFAAGAFYPNILPLRRFRWAVEAENIGVEFWGDFEIASSAIWKGGLGDFEGLNEGAQFSTDTTNPRVGTRTGQFLVRSGDQYLSTTGERAEVRRDGGFGVGDVDGLTVCTQFSVRFVAPWTMPSNWAIFHQQHADSRYTQPPIAFQANVSTGALEVRLRTGNYPTATDATNGTNNTVDKQLTIYPAPLLTDTWYDIRYRVHWSSSSDGSLVVETKLSTDTDWVRRIDLQGIQTLPTTTGDPTPGTIFDKIGFYRNASAFNNTVRHGGYRVGHSFADVDYSAATFPADPRFNQYTWEGAPIINDNYDFETNINGTSQAGGGTVTRTQDSTRSKFGTNALKLVTNGAAAGQGAFLTLASGTRMSVTAGNTYTASAWMSGDGFEPCRIGIEWFDSGGASISTTFSGGKSLRTTWQRYYLTATAPVGAVTARIRTGLSSAVSLAATFWVDGDVLWEGAFADWFSEGIWYVTNWGHDYNVAGGYHEAVVECVDGFGVLTLDALDLLDPPDATSYADVVAFDQPSFYYRLGEPEGTKLVSHVRKKKRKGRIVKKRFKTVETAAEVEGLSGPSGTYKGSPTLGEPGAILGDPDTSVLFTPSLSQYARIGPLDQSDAIDQNRLTVEAWCKANASGVALVSGPLNTTAGRSVFALYLDVGGGGTLKAKGTLEFTDGTAGSITHNATTPTGSWHYYAFTWDGMTLRLYIDGVEDPTVAATYSGKVLRQGDTNEYIRIGAWMNPTLDDLVDGWIDEAAIYEKALTPERILAHYTAGTARGFAEQSAGARVSAVATSSLWSETAIQSSTFNVQPVMETGQAKLDEILETVKAERPISLFYFNGAGDPVYLGWDFRDGTSYSTPQATFGDSGSDVPYEAIDIAYDDEVYNDVTLAADGGESQQVTDATSQSSYFRRAFSDSGLVTSSDSNVAQSAQAILDGWKDAQRTVRTMAMRDTNPESRPQILARQVGDMIRVKRKPGSGATIDYVGTILGRRLTIDGNGELFCTWNLSRGFNAALAEWQLGVSGFSELDTTTTLA